MMRRFGSLALPVAAMVVGALLLSGCSGFGTPSGYQVKAKVPRTFNLFPGSPVMVMGVDVGIIETLDVEPGADHVLATMRIRDGVQLPEDVHAVMLTDALLGERFLQLVPPYQDGPTFPPDETIEERVDTPAEFDELLIALQNFIDGIKDGDLPRLVDNLAEVLDGNGEDLGRTFEAVRDAMQVLQDHDDDLLRLASKLSDVNETLNQRRTELGDVVQDFSELSRILADQRVPLEQALSSLARLADETGRLLDANRTMVEDDVQTLTRVGRTAARNVDQISNMILGSAELFRHAERAIAREHHWLPLVNNGDDLASYLLTTIIDRLAGGFLCEREGIDTDLCQQLAGLLEELPLDEICIPGLIECPGGNEPGSNEAVLPLGEAITKTLQEGSSDVGDSPEDRAEVQRLVDEVAKGLGLGGSAQGDSNEDGGLLGGGP